MCSDRRIIHARFHPSTVPEVISSATSRLGSNGGATCCITAGWSVIEDPGEPNVSKNYYGLQAVVLFYRFHDVFGFHSAEIISSQYNLRRSVVRKG